MARPTATQEQRDEQRNRIRRAAAELYDEGGLPALSVRAVAKRAGVSTGLLYSYFSNMSDLLRTIWVRPVAEFGREVGSIVESHPEPVERIEALLSAYAAWAYRYPDVYRGVLLFVRPPTTSPPDRRNVDELPLQHALRTAIEQGQSAGSIRTGEPATMAQVLWAGVHGCIALPTNIDTYTVSPPTDLVPEMISGLMRSLEPTDPHTSKDPT